MSEPGHPAGRHAVVHATGKESNVVREVIEGYVIKGTGMRLEFNREGNPKTTKPEEWIWKFRLHKRFIPSLLLAFPTADLSPSIIRRMRTAEEKRIEGMEVPVLKLKKVLKPAALKELTDYQKVGIEKIYNREITLLNDDMGLGKTRQVLTAVAKRKWFPALVVCPNNAKYEWQRQAQRDFYGLRVAVMDATTQTPAQRTALVRAVREGRYDILVVNAECLRARPMHKDGNSHAPITGWDFAIPALFEHRWRYCVVDEHHRFKTPDAQVTRGLFQLRAYRYLMMSGTPVLNSPEEFWAVLKKMYPDDFPEYEPFKKRLVIHKPAATEEVTPAYNPEAMAELREFVAGISLRRRKDQVLAQLPPVFHIDREVELTKEQKDLYNEINDDFLLTKDDGSKIPIVSVLAHIIRLKQACFSPELYEGAKHSAKIEALKEDVEALVANKEKVIIFSQWATATRIIERELKKFNPAYVDGSIKPKDRQVQQDRFMGDPSCHAYVGTIGANREAINLGVASHVIFTDIDWSPMAKDQAIGRSAAGGLRGLNVRKGLKVHVIEYRGADTIEVHLARFTAQKRAIIGRTVDNDGGKAMNKISANELMRLLRKRV
jgi:SNF2 family DNA or RNA helicase